MQNFKRGEIYYVSYEPVCGHEQQAGRPAVIVSNATINRTPGTVEVVYLTTKKKKIELTRVITMGTGVRSVALCEQITTVSTSRIGARAGRVSEEEMKQIDAALMFSLGLDERTLCQCPGCVADELSGVLIENERLLAKIEQMEKMYRELMDRRMG